MPHGIFKNSALGNAGIFTGGPLGSLSGEGVFAKPTALGSDLSPVQACKLQCRQAWEGEPYAASMIVSCEDECEQYYGGAYTPPQQQTSGQSCNSDPVIRLVQSKIGAAVDGKWGQESQGKLQASGKTFQQLAPGCTPPVPSYSSGGGYVSPQPQPQPQPAGPAEQQAGMLTGITGALTQKFAGLPVGVWGLGIFVLTAGAVAVAREKGWV